MVFCGSLPSGNKSPYGGANPQQSIEWHPMGVLDARRDARRRTLRRRWTSPRSSLA